METNVLKNSAVEINNTVDLTDSSTKVYFSIYDYIIPTIGVLIILTNLMVVISSGLILKKGQQPRSTYLFLGNVAMTDMITGFAVVFGQLYPKTNRNQHVCAFQLGLIVSSTLTSIYSVGLIAVDRFLYILYGLQYAKWVYPTRARSLIALTWIIGGIIGFLPLMGWRGDTNNGKICWFILLAPKELVLFTVLMGMIPILVVVVLYSIILHHAIGKIVQLQEADTNRNNAEESTSSGNLRIFQGRNKSESDMDDQLPAQQDLEKSILQFFKKKRKPAGNAPNKWKAIKVVLFTTGSFIITWSPYFIASLTYVYSCVSFDNDEKKCKTLRILIASPLAILGFMNSFINPIIYAWWHKGFRSFVTKRIINRLAMKKIHPENPQSKSVPNSRSTNSQSASES